MEAFARPRVVVSKCLEFDACRYNGDVIYNDVIKKLMDYVDFVPVCPEVEIGLGTPRETIRIVKKGGSLPSSAFYSTRCNERDENVLRRLFI